MRDLDHAMDLEWTRMDLAVVIRIAFDDRDRDIDFVLGTVERDVDARDAGVGKTPVGVECLDPLQVRVEPRTVERRGLAPGDA